MRTEQDAEVLRDQVARKLWDRAPALARAVHRSRSRIDSDLFGTKLVLEAATDPDYSRLDNARTLITEVLAEVDQGGDGVTGLEVAPFS